MKPKSAEEILEYVTGGNHKGYILPLDCYKAMEMYANQFRSSETPQEPSVNEKLYEELKKVMSGIINSSIEGFNLYKELNSALKEYEQTKNK